MADPDDRNFDPSTAEANLARQQGLGVGQRELEAQGDPTLAEGRQGHRRPHAMDPPGAPDLDR